MCNNFLKDKYFLLLCTESITNFTSVNLIVKIIIIDKIIIHLLLPDVNHKIPLKNIWDTIYFIHVIITLMQNILFYEVEKAQPILQAYF